jgi:hypothetical protein
VSGPTTSTFGFVGGSGETTPSVADGNVGVVGPHAGVNSAIPFGPGGWFRSTGRRWPFPRHVPKTRSRSTRSDPSAAIPVLERSAIGGESSTPSRRRTPLGRLSAGAKRSPLTPAAVAAGESVRCISVTRSAPRMALFERTGSSVQSPPGRGALMTWMATGPCDVNCTWRSYVTPGMSSCRPAEAVAACAGAADAPTASEQTMTSARSTDPSPNLADAPARVRWIYTTRTAL